MVEVFLRRRYVFQGFWLTLRPVESFHHSSIAASAEKLSSEGPSTLTSNKSSKVEPLSFVRLSFLITFIVDNRRSTLAVEG